MKKTFATWIRRRRLALISAAVASAVALGTAMTEAQSDGAAEVHQIERNTTPRRTPPASRYDFRGEHAGVIYTPRGWGAAARETGGNGQYFVTQGGFPVYIPYGGGVYQTEPVVLGSSYEIVRRPEPGPEPAPKGRYEVRAREEVIQGQYVQVYHPAVYETDDEGRLQLVEKEQTLTEPKVRVILERVWIAGPERKAFSKPR